ncbi:hypothetical protein ONS95_012563 [Cadophora gregata]|uniref:uncharacterized protein n=1 Tax=Cadophora gregata TaxID=51156 RepID=UPI0026DCF398|nr:uncharacterized protein ONS95_012563 [Cadophora gregata]KAK0118262.1 hypothetical protein ONS95_012563 [Cadophora gregata]KAK0123335.1 hypothetical protein ONS96_010329 [Cadophora gregata f. sp. sojae]
MFAQGNKLSASDEAFRAVGLVDDDDLVSWTDSNFLHFFRINHLPTWGSRRIWMERHARFEREQNYSSQGRHHEVIFDSKGVVQRSVRGVETYAWDAVLAGSSVQALKGSLFEAGHFPSDSMLNLYFGRNRGTPLEDDTPLSFYEPADWRKLSLEITRTSQAENTDKTTAHTEPPVVFYKPRIPGTKHWLGEDRNGTPISDHSNDDITNIAHLPKRPLIPKDVQRIYDLTHHKSQPTVTELLDSIHTRAQELIQIQNALGARDTLPPHLKTVRSKSVVEMLDNFRDLQEVREERQRLVDLQVETEEVREGDRMKRVKLGQEMGLDVGAGDGGMGGVGGQVRGRSYIGDISRELNGRE